MNQATAQRHPYIELLSRYRAVLEAAWQARHELAGPKRLADETAFLPAALSLQQTPPHPSPMRAAWAIVALFTLAGLWSFFGQVDIVAVAHGRVVVSDRTKVIQPLETSVVKAIHVKDGDHVQAGQLLIELDSTASQADTNRATQEQVSALADSLRYKALLKAVNGKPLKLEKSTGLSAAERTSTLTQMEADWADIQSKSAKINAEIEHRRTEIATVKQQIAKLENTLPMLRQREQDFLALSKEGFVASHAGQDRTRERVEMEKDLDTQTARLAEAKAALQESKQARTSFEAETQKTLQDKLAEADLKRGQMTEEVTKATQRQSLMRMTAPVSGTVQQLAIHTTGGVVTPAQALLVVVPDQAQVTAEVQIENQDIGFVHEGQQAEIKLEAFPYTRYGTIPATLQVVAADAVTRQTGPAVDPATGAPLSADKANAATAVFPAILTLSKTYVEVEGKKVRLTPGMTLSAEVKTGKRRVIDYLLSPIAEHANESMRER